MNENIKLFPTISSMSPWNNYKPARNRINVFPTLPVNYGARDWEDVETIIHDVSGNGYIELDRGQRWADIGYKKGDRFSFFKGETVYKIKNIVSNVAQIEVDNTDEKKKKIHPESVQLSSGELVVANRRIVVPIPVYGRFPLVRETIKRLKRQTLPISQIILMGCEQEVGAIAEEEGVLYTYCDNYPLGYKWQHGMDYARKFNPDAVLMLGSSDWISDNWCEVMMREIERGADLVGKRKMMFLDAGEDGKHRLLSWNGYERFTLNSRDSEPIGAGRLYSRKILDAIGWQIYNVNSNNSMDFCALCQIVSGAGEVKMVRDPCDTIMALSISFYHKWGNLHGFDSLYKSRVTPLGPQAGSANAKKVSNVNEVLTAYFPGWEAAVERINKF